MPQNNPGKFVPVDAYTEKYVFLVARNEGEPIPVLLPADLLQSLDDPNNLKPSLGALTSLSVFDFEIAMPDDGPNTATITPAAINTGNAVVQDDENDDEFDISPGIYLILVACQTNAATEKRVEIAVDGENGSALLTQNTVLLPGNQDKISFHRTLEFGPDAIAGTLGITGYCADSEPGMSIYGEITFFKVGGPSGN